MRTVLLFGFLILFNNQSVGSSAPVVSRCFPGGYNVKLYISRGRLAWWFLAFLCCDAMILYEKGIDAQENQHVIDFLCTFLVSF